MHPKNKKVNIDFVIFHCFRYQIIKKEREREKKKVLCILEGKMSNIYAIKLIC